MAARHVGSYLNIRIWIQSIDPLVRSRARHIRCDESPGTCNNCKSGKWTCEYDVVRMQSHTPGDRKKSPPEAGHSLSVQRLSRNVPGRSPEEKRAFNFFRHFTLPGLESLVDSGSPLWSGLVLPMSHSEPAVQHAVIALSALHEDLDERGAPLAREELSNRLHRFAIGQFGRALSKLNERRHSQDPQFRNVVLTCCLLFVTYEWLRGNGETALVHLSQGFAIILETPISKIDQSLLSAMVRLQNQAMFFGFWPKFIWPERPDDTEDNDYGFLTLQDAQSHLDRVVSDVCYVPRTAYRLDLETRLPHLHPDLAERQQIAIGKLNQFARKLSQTERRYHIENMRRLGNPSHWKTQRDQRSLALIRLHYTLWKVGVETSLPGTDLSIFDKYLDEFRIIVDLSRYIANSFRPDEYRPSFLLDMGINIPLSFVCWKCQSDDLREQALEVLESWPHHEGSTGTKLCLLFMKQIRDLELATIQASSRSYTRVAEASMDLTEDQTKGVLTYQYITPDQQVVIETKVISYE